MYKRYYDIDVDAKAYANNIVKAGGRIPSDIGSVSDFIRRLKQDNLYHSLIDMWFCRNNQNDPNPNKLYAFKSPFYDGIIIPANGSPTWTANGIRTSTVADFTTPPIWIPNGAALLARYPVTSMCVFNCYNTSWSLNGYWMYGNAYNNQTTNQGNGGWFRAAVGVDVLNQMRNQTLVSASTFTHGIFQFNSNTTINQPTNNSKTYKNGTLSATQTAFGPILPPPTNSSGGRSYQIGNSTGTTTNGTISFHAVFENDFSATDHLNFYNIYKATAGKGLGLP